jgi:hypothetical protein
MLPRPRRGGNKTAQANALGRMSGSKPKPCRRGTVRETADAMGPPDNEMMKLPRINSFDASIETRLMDGPQARHRVRRLPIGSILLRHAASVGLALLLTAGFAAGLSLYAGRFWLDARPLGTCGWFFAWCVLLLGAASNA